MNKVSILIMLLLLTSIKSISQNATVVYQGSNLSNINNCPQCCNVFNQSGNNPTVGGLNHFPVSGGAIFDGTSIKMQTQVNSQSNINNGTAYALGYTFKTGYNYTMTVDMGYTANPSTAFPKLTMSVRTSLPNPNDSDPISCGPVSSSKYLSSIGDIVQIVYPSQTSIQTYNIPQFSVPSQRNYRW